MDGCRKAGGGCGGVWKSWKGLRDTKLQLHNTYWQIGGETMETVRDFILGGSKITADGDWSHEIQRHLLLRRKDMTNLESVLKSRDITLPTNVCLSQSYGFSSSHAWMWELDHEEGWALKNWCFWTVVLEKTLESPLDCKEIQPVHLKEISPGCSLEGLMLKLKLQYFGHLMWRNQSLERTLMLGKTEGRRRGNSGWHHQLKDMSLSRPRDLVMDREAWCAAIHWVTKSRIDS